MSLSCDCDYDYYDPEPGDWEYDWSLEQDFEPLNTSKRKRCISCNNLIDIGSESLKQARKRHPYTEIEARCNGVDFDNFEEPVIKIAPVYQCEKCGEIWLNLQNVGFECLSPGENMVDALKQYQEEYAPPKLK